MKLVVLQLDANHLTSLLAQILCQSSYLQNFTANSNHLIGPIPKTVRNCMRFFRVHLKRNQIRENISEDFGIYKNLWYIDLRNN